MDAPTTERKTKFQALVETYLQSLNEDGFPPMAPINTPSNTTGGGTPQTGVGSTSALDVTIEQDPAVAAAKKKAALAIELQLKQKANTITNP